MLVKSSSAVQHQKRVKIEVGEILLRMDINILKHVFLLFSSNSDRVTHLMLGSLCHLDFFPYLVTFPGGSAKAVSLLQVVLGEVVCAKQVPLSVLPSWP